MRIIRLIMQNLDRYSFFLDRRAKFRIVLWLFLIVLNICIEILSITLLIPIIGLIANFNFLNEYIFISDLLASFNFYLDTSYSLQLRMLSGALTFFLLLIIIKNLFLVFVNFYRLSIAEYLNKSTNKIFVKKYLSMPYSHLITKDSSEVFTNFNLISNVINVIDHSLIILSESLVLLFLSLFLIFSNIAVSTIVLPLIIFCFFFVIFSTRKKIFNLGNLRRESQATSFFYLRNAIDGIKDIKIFNIIPFFLERFLQHQYLTISYDKYFNFLSNLTRPVFEIFIVLAACILSFMLLIQNSEPSNILVTLGVLMAAFIRVIPSFGKIINSLQMIKYLSRSVNQILDQFRIFRKVNQPLKEVIFDRMIKLKNITHSYKNSKIILKNYFLEIKKKDKILIIGKSGYGKTTIVNILCGLIKPKKGKVIIDNKILDQEFSIKNLSYVSQSPFFYNDTILSNIAFGVPREKIDYKLIMESVEISELSEVIKKLKYGLNTIVGEKGSQLSGGQMQRIAIARAIYRQPDIFILDEATSALDLKTEMLILDKIFKIYAEKTLILISHKKNLKRYCSKTLNINFNSK